MKPRGGPLVANSLRLIFISMRLQILLFLILLYGSGCATYYQVNQRFNTYFEQGELEKAEALLDNNEKVKEGKAKLLYYMNRGLLAAMQGAYEESNRFFEEAYILGEDLRNNLWNTTASLFTNPNLTYYTGEDHELLLIHYYKALNFLKLGDHEAALVECRRLNIKLNTLSDKYRSGVLGTHTKYTRDAFIHNLMGIIYEADGDYNNAFIAYRNAVEAYRNDYQEMFGLGVPDQLKHDLLHAAYLIGFDEELRQYEKEFDMHYQHQSQPEKGELVFFWNNGLGPVKSEWGITFALIRGEGGLVTFRNDEFGWSFPFYLEDEEDYEKKGLNKVEFIRVAFPKYVERPLVFHEGSLKAGNATYPLELGEDVNGIAFRSLQQRMMKEFAISLLRVALKKAAEYSAREQNEDLGAILGLVNAVTEKADTRNWQTIPHSIYYTRVPMKAGENDVTLELNARQNSVSAQKHTFTFDIKKGETFFYSFHSLKSQPIPGYYY